MFELELVYRYTQAAYSTSLLFRVEGVAAAPAPPPEFYESPLVIGGGVLACCLLAVLVAVIILCATRTKNDGPQVPKLTPALLRETIFGKGLSNPADARAYLAHLQGPPVV